MAYLEKLRHLKLAIKQNGGIVGSFLQLFRTDELKWGDLVGEDKYGNKYYQNKMYFVGRSRWIQYSEKNIGWDYEGSQVPAEWHRWLHYITDEVPSKENLVIRKWMLDHKQNLTGTSEQYVPYSTTKPKIEAWSPKSS